MREDNEIEKNENESEDGVVQHSNVRYQLKMREKVECHQHRVYD